MRSRPSSAFRLLAWLLFWLLFWQSARFPAFYVYDYASGNLVGVSDSSGHGTSFAYDSNGQKTGQSTSRTLINPDGSSAGVQQISTAMTLDADGRVTKTILPEGATTQTHYNAIGKVDTTLDALKRVTTFHYNDLGQRDTTTYANGTKSSTLYDANGQVVGSIDRSGRGSKSGAFGLIYFGGAGLVFVYCTTVPDAQRRQKFIASCHNDTCGAPQMLSHNCTMSTGVLSIRYFKTYHNEPWIPYQLHVGKSLFTQDSAEKSLIAGLRKNYLCARMWSNSSLVIVHALFRKGSLIALYRDQSGQCQQLLTQAHPLSSSLDTDDAVIGGLVSVLVSVLAISAFFAILSYGAALKKQQPKQGIKVKENRK